MRSTTARDPSRRRSRWSGCSDVAEPRRRLGQDRQQRGQRLRPRLPRYARRCRRARGAELPAQPVGPLAAPGRSGVIALAVPALDIPVLRRAHPVRRQAAEQLGYTVLVDQTDGLREREQMVATGIPAPPDRRADPQPGRAGLRTSWPSGRRRDPDRAARREGRRRPTSTTSPSTTSPPPGPPPSTCCRWAGPGSRRSATRPAQSRSGVGRGPARRLRGGAGRGRPGGRGRR